MREAMVQSKASYFRQTTIWPLLSKFDTTGWLSNFDSGDKKYANQLLNNFLYFNRPFIEGVFRSTFLKVSQSIVNPNDSYFSAKTKWAQFLSRTLIVRVTGERPTDADSGYIFARMARDVLQVPEANLVSAEEAITRLKNMQWHNIIFVDDFVGSGSQFIKTWARKYPNYGTRGLESFKDLPNSIKRATGFYYCPIVCCTDGFDAISQECPEVKLMPAYTLDQRYSAIEKESHIWKEDFQDEGPLFVERISKKLGIPDSNGDVDDWRGFQKLGLSVAFEHGWPDATLPLYSWDKDGWKPLLRK